MVYLRLTQFEALVVQLLLKMVYGDGVEDAVKETQPNKDNGIDEIIEENQDGILFLIYPDQANGSRQNRQPS